MIRNVCLIAREFEGIAGAGGIKDAVRGLANALSKRQIKVTVFIPRYAFVEKGKHLYDVSLTVNGRSHIVSVSGFRIEAIEIRLLDSEYFSSKQGIYTYTESDAPTPGMIGKGHLDVHEMNTVLQAASIQGIIREGEAPDIIHGHDGHTGLLTLFMRKYRVQGLLGKTGVLVTIHNAGIAYQQIIATPRIASRLTGIQEDDFVDGIIDGKVNPLLIAGTHGHINTVSPEYSRELISGTDRHSGKLGSTYRSRKIPLKGVYNGIDVSYWLKELYNLDLDPLYAKHSLRRAVCRLLEAQELTNIRVYGAHPETDAPWVLFHGRLTEQKGIASLLELPAKLKAMNYPYRLIIHGQGNQDIENAIKTTAESNFEWTFLNGYSAKLASALIAASSFIVVPSEWEPCGQIDMVGQLLGALPIVRSVGGLKKVRHNIDGFRYSPKKKDGLAQVFKVAIAGECENKRRLSLMREIAKKAIYGRRTWDKVFERGYLPLYEKIRNKHWT